MATDARVSGQDVPTRWAFLPIHRYDKPTIRRTSKPSRDGKER